MAVSFFAAQEDPSTGSASGGGSHDLGPQPLDRVMQRLGLENHDLVSASVDPLTHKMVQKGRKGRRLTPKVQCRILRSLNRVLSERELPSNSGDSARFSLKDIFNY